MEHVDYSRENVTKCWCGQCPVQRESSCAKSLYEQAEPKMSHGEMPPKEQLPGLYCGTGKASCGDLKPVERCLCPECLVWGEHRLLANHYCLQGAADQLMA